MNSLSLVFFQNSCPGNSAVEVGNNKDFNKKLPSAARPEVEVKVIETERDGWIRCLSMLPNFSIEKLDNNPIMGSVTMPKDGPAPKAFRNKKHGYRLWKEGCVRAVSVKPNVRGSSLLFLVKSKVHASMKSVQYNVYVHLDQANGNVVHAKCNCKADQGDCCKHVAALIYTTLDYVNMDTKEIPRDLTCTQVVQKWHVPSGAN